MDSKVSSLSSVPDCSQRAPRAAAHKADCQQWDSPALSATAALSSSAGTTNLKTISKWPGEWLILQLIFLQYSLSSNKGRVTCNENSLSEFQISVYKTNLPVELKGRMLHKWTRCIMTTTVVLRLLLWRVSFILIKRMDSNTHCPTFKNLSYLLCCFFLSQNIQGFKPKGFSLSSEKTWGILSKHNYTFNF